jgi:hypothetical protein
VALADALQEGDRRRPTPAPAAHGR